MKPIPNPPRGMRDFYPADMALRNRIFDAWRTAAARYGFAPYDACVVESLDLLKRKSGEEIVEQIYAFTDKSGRNLALRPEMTPTLARMVAARQVSLALPLKWFSIAQCFRYERTTKGRKREHFQWNLDIIGEPSVSAEVEVVAAAAAALEMLSLRSGDVKVLYSSRALLSDLLERVDVAREHHAATFLALDKRGKIDDEAISELLAGEGLDDEAMRKVFELLSVRTFEDAVELLGKDTAAVRDIRRFVELAAAAGLEDNLLVFDVTVIRGLAYYTGIVFEAFDVKRSLRALFGGGRYDNLLAEVGGDPMTGVGLGFGDVVVAELLADRGESTVEGPVLDLAVGFMQEAQQLHATRVAAELRSQGKSVDLALKPEKPKAFFSRAGKGGFAQAVYLGPDDVERGVARLKDLTTREEEDLPLTAT